MMTLPEASLDPSAGPLAKAQESAAALPACVLIVDDHILFRHGLVSFLGAQPEMKIVGQAGSVREAIGAARQLRPDLVLMDFILPDGTGVGAMRTILTDQPTTKIVFLTAHDNDDRLFEALRAGAIGYLCKDAHPTELLQTLRSVCRGEAGISGSIARRVLEEFARLSPRRPDEPDESATHLTAREMEIVHELARGATNQEIAQRLVISQHTVKKHVCHILEKLHRRSRSDVADYARTHGLVASTPD